MTRETVDLSRIRALTIDDNAFSRRLLRAMLEQMGIADIVEAEDGAAGIAVARACTPDIVLLDWIMPECSGADTLRSMKQAGMLTPQMPVLVTSIAANREAIVEAARLGAACFLVSPYATTTLRSRIERTLQHTPSRALQARAKVASR